MDAEALRQHLRVLVAHRGRVARGHGEGGDVARAERARGEDGGERGIDPAAEPEHRAGEPGLHGVVADPERQRVRQVAAGVVGQVGLGRGHHGQRARGSLRGAIGDHRSAPGAHGVLRRPLRAGREVVDQQILGECRRLALDLAVGADQQRAPVEDQRIVAAHQVAHGDGQPVPPGRCGEHPAPDFGLADGVRGGGDVEDRLGALRGQLLDGIAQVARLLPELLVVPQVLADGNADPHAGDRNQRPRILCRVEVAALVERRRRWAAATIADHGGDASSGEHRDGVVEAGAFSAVALGEPHQRGKAGEDGVGRELLEHRPAAIDELAQLEQVLGRISAERQLGKEGPRSAPAAAACRARSRMRAALASNAPTVVSICASAIFMRCR